MNRIGLEDIDHVDAAERLDAIAREDWGVIIMIIDRGFGGSGLMSGCIWARRDPRFGGCFHGIAWRICMGWR